MIYDNLKFEGGSEYLYFDSKNILLTSNEIKRVDFKKIYNTTLYTDFEESVYTLQPDLNGTFILSADCFEKNISTKDYNHWVLDLQGAELLVLKGSEKSLKNCKSLLIEVSTKQFYSNGDMWLDIKKWLNQRGFKNYKEPEMDEEDILFIRSI